MLIKMEKEQRHLKPRNFCEKMENMNYSRLILPACQKTLYNLTVFIERYRFNACLRYTYRDNFLLSFASDITNTLPIYTADRGQLNGSMSTRLTRLLRQHWVALTFSNLETNPGVAGPIAQMSDSDRRITLGLYEISKMLVESQRFLLLTTCFSGRQ